MDSLILGVHLVGASVWVGGSVTLGVTSAALARYRRQGPEAAVPVLLAVAREVSRVLWVALALTILTGLYNLTWYLPPGATLSAYPILEAKILLVGLMVVLSALHTFVVGVRLRRRREAGASPEATAPLQRAMALLAVLSLICTFGVVFLAAFLGGP